MNRKLNIFFAISVVVLCVLACNANLPQIQPSLEPTHSITINSTPTLVPNRLPETDAEVPRVSLDKAKTAYDNQTAVFVDVRSPDAYAASHVKGAVLIPLANIMADPSSLPYDKTQWIITYCT